MTAFAYPKTRRVDVVDDHFGVPVADPYRWLENDARTDAEVAAWVDAQNALTTSHLATLPARAVFRKRLKSLFDHEQLTAPQKRSGRYFHLRNPGLWNQAALYVRDSVDGPDRVLIDPNGWDAAGATALAEWSASHDGRHVAFGVQEDGTDWRTIRVLAVDTGTTLSDEVRWARFTSIVWAYDGSGYFYSRYPAPEAGAAFGASIAGHAVYFHAIGTSQDADRLVHSTPEQPGLVHVAALADDGRHLAIYSTPGASSNALTLIDLQTTDWTPRHVVEDFAHQWTLAGSADGRLFFVTDQGAERGRIVSLDMSTPAADFQEVVPEQAGVVNDARVVGERILVAYLTDAKTQIRRFTLAGAPNGEVALPGIGSAGGFRGESADNEVFFVFTSLNAPTSIYRYDVATGTSTTWAEPDVSADLDRIVVEQHFATSRDGTRVPMFVMRRRDVTGPAPTLLYGYGGFSISMLPFYSPAQVAWVEQGGVMAIANLRGGAEYGQRWHHAGRRDRKQNVFDDFIAVATYLKDQGITAPDGLAIQGESNGGLLVGAVVNQRPDLFAAALPGVGVMDMLRFDRFTGGTLWRDEFGDPSREDDFRTLYAYSPYHRLQPGRPYPAILAATADTDNRVVPGHTFKYIAAAQAMDLGPRPRLVRIETKAGHGAGKPMEKVIDEVADLWAFAARWTGLAVSGE